MGVGTALSRATGVARIFALAYALGSGIAASPADAYNLANTIPNIVQDLVLGGVLSATFVPVFVQRLQSRPRREAEEAISAVCSVALVVLAAASVVFLVVTPFLIDALTALRHSAAEQTVGTDLLVLFVPQVACYGVSSIAAALLNARGRFAAPMFAPIANNVVCVAVLLWFATLERHPTLAELQTHRSDLVLLGLGTTAGVVLQTALVLPSVRRSGLLLSWRPDWHHEAVRTIVRLSGWTFGLVAANQVALAVVLALFNKIKGGVSAYTYAFAFFQVPYGIVGVSVMTATAPTLAALWTRHDVAGFRVRTAIGLRATLAIVLPAAGAELVLARPLVALLLGYHATVGPAGTVLTAQTLAMLAVGLPGFCTFLFLVRALQAMQDLRSAFFLYVVENGANVVLAVVLVGPLGVRGIALSISAAYSVAAVAALVVVRRRLGGLGEALTVLRPLARVVVATAALVGGTAIGSNVTTGQSASALLVRVAAGTFLGAAVYLVVAAGLGSLERRRRPRGRHAG